MKFNEQKKYYREGTLTQSEIQSLPDCRGFDIVSARGKGADVIRNIHSAMCRLAAMGDDERRSLWVEVKGKKWEWYEVTTSVYDDCHYLYLTGDTYDHHAFCDKENPNSHNHWYNEDYILPVLLKLESYVGSLVDRILSNPTQYNEYVEKYLSPYRRTGLIKRSILNALLPSQRMEGLDIKRLIRIYETRRLLLNSLK